MTKGRGEGGGAGKHFFGTTGRAVERKVLDPDPEDSCSSQTHLMQPSLSPLAKGKAGLDKCWNKQYRLHSRRSECSDPRPS